eukprot:TRINITY_DN24272_c0_g1_i1.p1 TRINITY_DN24272_c0_g1~~TRINITY_DN24272_c0_g1_i1.p1  ORF type:complete len:488 (-),score=78.38 TRINITY_DN24272_c0_g1_i1:62-1525(-)
MGSKRSHDGDGGAISKTTLSTSNGGDDTIMTEKKKKMKKSKVQRKRERRRTKRQQKEGRKKKKRKKMEKANGRMQGGTMKKGRGRGSGGGGKYASARHRDGTIGAWYAMEHYQRRKQSRSKVYPRPSSSLSSSKSLLPTVPNSVHHVDVFCVCGCILVSRDCIHHISEEGHLWTNNPVKGSMYINSTKQRNNNKTLEMFQIGHFVIIYQQYLRCASCAKVVGAYMKYRRCSRSHSLIQYKIYNKVIIKGDTNKHVLCTSRAPKVTIEEAVVSFLQREGDIMPEDIDKLQLRADGMIKSSSYIPWHIFLPNWYTTQKIRGLNQDAEDLLLDREQRHLLTRKAFLEESGIRMAGKWHTSPRFQFLIQILEKYNGANTAWKEFNRSIRWEFHYSLSFFVKCCNAVHDQVYHAIASSPLLDHVLTAKIQSLAYDITSRLDLLWLVKYDKEDKYYTIPRPEQDITRGELYLLKNSGIEFVSIDLKSANFNTL